MLERQTRLSVVAVHVQAATLSGCVGVATEDLQVQHGSSGVEVLVAAAGKAQNAKLFALIRLAACMLECDAASRCSVASALSQLQSALSS